MRASPDVRRAIRWRLLAAVLAAGILWPVGALRAQAIPASQRGAVTQRVGLTDLTVEYSRPSARGRQLFPGIVAWGRVWNPGADSATLIRLSRDAVVEGVPVTSGEYSVWIIPREEGPWTLVLHRQARVFHTPYPGEAGEALRVPVAPVASDHMETLAFYFPVVARDSTVLRMHWGRTVIPIRIRTPLED